MNLKKFRSTAVPFEFTPFSKKQMQVLTWWGDDSPYRDFDSIIADGSIRSGKTVSLALSFVTWAMNSFSGENFAICGKTIHACRRNVIGPLKQMLIGMGYDFMEIRNDNLLIVGRQYYVGDELVSVINQFHIFGGKDEAAQDLIQGITLAGIFFDEVALMPKSFVEQGTGRCSVEGSKFWFSCNPGPPMHWFYKEWIEGRFKKKALYLHFTMDDNPTLSKNMKDRYKRNYTGIFFKRFVLGLWVLADGVVYPMFDSSKHRVEYERNWSRVFISGDFGVQNATTFGLYGYYEPEEHYHLIDRFYHSGRDSKEQRTTKMYADSLVAMIRKNQLIPQCIYLDPSATAMIVELKKHPYIRARKIPIVGAMNSVILGIQFHAMLLESMKFTISSKSENTLKDVYEYGAYVWNEKSVDQGKDRVVEKDDHCMDSNRYGPLTDAIRHGAYAQERESFSGRGARTAA